MSDQLANIDAVLLKFRRLLGHMVFSLPLLIGSFVIYLPLLTSYLIWGSRLVQSHSHSQDAHSVPPDTSNSAQEERYRRQGVPASDFNATQAAQATQEAATPRHYGHSETTSSAAEADHERDYRIEQERRRSEEQRQHFEEEELDNEEVEELRRGYEQ